MFNKLAGHLPLADMVARIIDDSRSKIAAAEGEKEEKKEKKLIAYEKKEHGHTPSVKEEEEEKKASAIDYSDPEEVEKLASALDQVGEMLVKEAADQQYHGNEYKGGGETLSVMAPVPGKQSYKKDSSKAHNVPEKTPEQKGDGGGPAKTQVENDHAPGKLLKYLHSEYPKKGVLKTAAGEEVKAKKDETEPKAEEPKTEETPVEEKPKSAAVQAIQAALSKVAEFPPMKEGEKKEEKGEEKKDEKKAPPFAKKEEKKESKEEKKEEGEEKKASASSVDYILSKLTKVAEGEVERRMGGETLDSKSGDGPKAPSQPGRQLISSNAAATNAKKVQAKDPRKKEMAQVLTEPMNSKAHDSKVQDNLRNASKGGVKIAAAAARELLKKIASEGCTCEGKGTCKYCKMKDAKEKKSMGGMPMVGSPGAGSSMPSM